MDYPKRYDKDGFPDDDGCYADAYETTDEIARLTAEIAVLREVLVTAKQETKWHDRRTGHKCMCVFCEAVRAALDAALGKDSE